MISNSKWGRWDLLGSFLKNEYDKNWKKINLISLVVEGWEYDTFLQELLIGIIIQLLVICYPEEHSITIWYKMSVLLVHVKIQSCYVMPLRREPN